MKTHLILALSFIVIFFYECKKDDSSFKIQSLNSGTTSYLSSVYFTDINNGYAVGYNGIKGCILKTINGGQSWKSMVFDSTAQMQTELTSVYFSNANIGYAVGWVGTILKTNDAGVSWKFLSSGTTYDLHSVNFINPDTGYAVGVGGSLITTIDGGKSWSNIKIGAINYYTDLNSVCMLKNGDGFAVGKDGMILRTINPNTTGGLTWVQDFTFNSTDAPQYLMSVYFVNSNLGFAVGGSANKGTIIKTIDSGKTWSVILTGEYNLLWSVYFLDSNIGYAVGQGGTIIKTENGGGKWNLIPSGTDNTLTSIYFPYANTGYIVGQNGVIIKIEN